MKPENNFCPGPECDHIRTAIKKRKSLQASIRLLVGGVLLSAVVTLSALNVYMGMKLMNFLAGSAMVFLAGAGSVMVDGDTLNQYADSGVDIEAIRQAIAEKVERIVPDKSKHEFSVDLEKMVDLCLVKKMSGRWEYVYDSQDRYGEGPANYGNDLDLIYGVPGEAGHVSDLNIRISSINGRISAFAPVTDSRQRLAGIFIASVDRRIVLLFKPFLVAGVTAIGVAVFIFFTIISKHVSVRMMRPLQMLEQKIKYLASSGEDRCGEYIVCEDSFREVQSLADATNMVVARHHQFIDRLNEQKMELTAQNQQLEAQQQQLLAALEELKETQIQLVQSEKMASLGQLTAGIAHEINTPLGAINSNTDLIGLLLKKAGSSGDFGEEAENLLNKIKKANDTSILAVERIIEIVRTLKNFSRLDEAEFQETDLHQGIESVLLLAQHLLKNNIAVIRDYGEIPAIQCYPNQLNQVFMNIVVNATQSIEGRGEIKIKTGVDGDRVYIEIADTGRGIPPGNLDRIFDPGFTTKGVGVGTGLGLSICYNIVKKHRGAIEVQSEPGQGSTFRIILPVRQSSGDKPRRP